MSAVADTDEVRVSPDRAAEAVCGIMARRGCDGETTTQVAEHLVEADLAGVASHGVFRIIGYAEQYDRGELDPRARPERTATAQGGAVIDGKGGIGIPAMELATEVALEAARAHGLGVVAVRHAGHTGRLGAFTERAARAGCLAIVIGGGGRQRWRQVAPFGGRKGMLPTNPLSIGMPGGGRGPVVLDFATAAAAGGWIYRARASGTLLPEGLLIDPEGRPSRNPEDYFRGGAILPAAGPKGYGLAVIAEMIGEAMLGPATTECNWLMLALDTGLYREGSALQATAEEVLAELRACPPADGHERVEVPGERERDLAERSRGAGLRLPVAVWRRIVALEGADAGAP